MNSKNITTANVAEIKKFSDMADEWWDEQGKFKPLHKMNPVRIEYIKNIVGDFKGKKVLDIGCGGGLLSIPMARMGAKVIGIDASSKNISIAENYAKRQHVELDYEVALVEEFSKNNEGKFDFVTALEIIEHVDNVELFLNEVAKTVKPGGLLFVSTINKTLKSFALAKVAAEYILRWVPKGTHDWNKFITPVEISNVLCSKFEQQDLSGMVFNPITNSWSISSKVDVNYIMAFKKK